MSVAVCVYSRYDHWDATPTVVPSTSPDPKTMNGVQIVTWMVRAIAEKFDDSSKGPTSSLSMTSPIITSPPTIPPASHTSSSVTAETTSSAKKHNCTSVGIGVGVGVGIFVCLLAIATVMFFLKRHRQHQDRTQPHERQVNESVTGKPELQGEPVLEMPASSAPVEREGSSGIQIFEKEAGHPAHNGDIASPSIGNWGDLTHILIEGGTQNV
ncbi:hypothetical protein CC80DRAFT_558086 [Byssothecium circinans]|uniref:Mid2 domain-containing protein n=1 Tax=Byssothecium circinans TaxID=147558 RepID=A0A6A5U1Y0_9PLEO|nr:hypothetical protein CC80DRAFT_558086 [Byssothecium circinans]